MISPIAWLCSDSRTMLSATDSICSWMRCMPWMVPSTDLRPACDTCATFCALSETYLAFWLETPAACFTSSTVAVVSLTALAVSAAPEATCVVVARISLDEEARMPTPSFSSSVVRRRLSTIAPNARSKMPTSSARLSLATSTVRSLAATRSAARDSSRNGPAITRSINSASATPITMAARPTNRKTRND